MTMVSNKKLVCLFICFVLILASIFAAGVSAPTDKVSAADFEFSVSDGVLNGDQMEFTIEINSSVMKTTVYYRTISGTAIDGTHFIGMEGAIDFTQGVTSKVVSVAVLGAHEIYGETPSTAYANIDRDFFLEIYSDDRYETTDALGKGIISALPEYHVESDFFNNEITFLNDTAALVQQCYPNYILSIPALGGYYDAVSSGYLMKALVTYQNAAEEEVFTLGLSKKDLDADQRYCIYFSGNLQLPGEAKYAVQVYTDTAAECIVAFPTGTMTNVTKLSEVMDNSLVDGYVLMDNSSSTENYLFIETLEAGAGGYQSSTVTGKVYDKKPPSLLGVSGLNHPQKVGDELYISLVFDEIIDAELSTLIGSKITSDSGDFLYQYGAGSNVLVFKGILDATITDTINFGAFDGEIRDLSDNTIGLTMTQQSVTVQSQYTVEHYVYTASGFVVGHTEKFFDNVGETVAATEIDFAALSLDGYTTFQTVDTVDSGTVTAGGTLMLKLYYKITDVYLSDAGTDMAVGNAVGTPVKTFAAAKARLATDGTIHIIGTVTVSGTETWSLDGLGDAKLSRYAKNYYLIDVGGMLTLENIVIDGNRSGLNMGSKPMIKNSGAVVLNVGAILQNADSRNSEWGAAISNEGYLSINGGEIINNTSISGGAIYNLSTGDIEFYNGKIIDNTAIANGGGIYNQEGAIDISGGIFENNKAQSTLGGGGAIYNNGGSIDIKAPTKFNGNTASGSEGNGGAIYSTGTETTKGSIYMQSGELFNNTAKNGGAVYTDGNSYFVMLDGKIYNNTATLTGGGVSYGSQINTAYGDSNVIGGEISGNSAPVAGGLYLFGGEYIMEGAVISGNTAVSSGGGVGIKEAASFVLNSGSVVNNTATANGSTGGGIHNIGSLSILGGTISGNTADLSIGFNGGGIANLGGEFLLDGTVKIDDVIYLDYNFPMTLVALPIENNFVLFLTDWALAETVVAGGTDIEAGTRFDNFSILNPGIVLRASSDNKNIVVNTALSVTFNKNDTGAAGSMSKQYVLADETFTLSENSFTKNRHFFLGWATTAAGDVEYADMAQYTMSATDTTLYAKWHKTVPSWQDGYTASAFDGGDGTAEAPYLIANGAQLAYLASLTNSATPDYSSKNYKLTANIDLSINNFPELITLGVQKIIWIAIGTPENSFSGVFDGDGYVISGISFDLDEDFSLYYGLFGMTYEADIKNLGIRGINVVGEAEYATVGSIIGDASDTNLTNIFIEDITANVTLDAGYFGGFIGNAWGIVLESFYLRSDGADIILSGTPITEGTFGAANVSVTNIGYVYISGMQEVLYLNGEQEALVQATALEKLYNLSVKNNADLLKNGQDIRLFAWGIGDDYPTLQKVILRSTITLNNAAPLYALGQATVRTFDEAIISLAKDGVIVFDSLYTINGNQTWTLPNVLFGNAYMTGSPEYNSSFINVPGGVSISLYNIKIINNALDDSVYMFSVDGELMINGGTSIIGNAITASASVYILDDEMSSINLGGIVLTQNAPVILYSPLYSTLVFDEFIDDSTILAGDGTVVMDAALYFDKCSLSLPSDYHIQIDGNTVRGYTKKAELYFDILAADGGNGNETAPVNNLEMIKALVTAGGKVFVMSTVEISADTVWNLEGYDIRFTNDLTFDGELFNVTNAELTLKDMWIDLRNEGIILNADASLVLDGTVITLLGEGMGVAITVSETAYVKLINSQVAALIYLINDGISSGKIILSEEMDVFYAMSINNITENQLPIIQTDTAIDLTEYFYNFLLSSFENRLMLVNNEVNNTIDIKIQEYTVTFYDKQDGAAFGSETAQAPQTVQIYEQASQPADPFRLGYSFEGWYFFNGTEYVEYDFDSEVTEDLELVAFWQNYFGTEDAEGTEASPFVISEYSHLVNMSSLFGWDSEVYDSYKYKYYVLANNITAEAGFVMIGTQTTENTRTSFYGTFDGGGFVIKDFIVDSSDFAALIYSNYGTIKNLGIEGAMRGGFVGTFAIFNSGTIMNCYNGAGISAAYFGAGIAMINYDGLQQPGVEGFDPSLADQGEIINCYNFGSVAHLEPEAPAMLGGITTLLGSVIGCYNAAAVQGSPIAVDAQLVSDCYFNRDYYEDEAGFYTLSMVGETTTTHQNLLYNALEANAPGVWSQQLNDGHAWYYPQLKVFYDNGNYAYNETVYTVEIDFQNDEPNVIEYALQFGYAVSPADPTKPLYLFDGWTESGSDFDFATAVTSDLYVEANWVVYQLIFDATGKKITDITIAEGQENVEVTIPNYVTHIEIYAFMDKPVISSVVFAEGSSLVQINTYAFFNTSITELTLPSSIISILNNVFGGLQQLESVSVGEGALNHKTQDGVLYNADMTTLLFYPLNKSATYFEIPSSVTKIADYAFFDSYYRYGNASLQSIVLPDGLNQVGNVGLEGLSNLVSVVINNTAPLFTPDANVFRYFDEVEWLKKINDNLVIELPNYTAYTNYMSDSGWDDFDGHYHYPVVVSFDYQGATEGYSEVTRTTAGGIVDGEIIYNGMAMGAMPAPLKFGYDFLEWNTLSDGSGVTLTAETLLSADTQAYAIWQAWDEITLTSGAESAILVNGEEHFGKTVDNIIAVSSVTSVLFDNFDCAARINIIDKTVTLTGSMHISYLDTPIYISGASNVVLNLSVIDFKQFFIIYIPQGSDETKVEYLYQGVSYKFLQSSTVDINIFSDGASVPHPGPGYDILCWNAEGNIGRNTQTVYFEKLPAEYVYSPITAPEVFITDTTTDYTYNAAPQGVTYKTYLNYDDPVDFECDIAYFATEADMLARINDITTPEFVGTYYYVISRGGRMDYCDATEVEGSYTINKAVVTVASTGVAISKTFDGNNSYTGAFAENQHYTVTGIVDTTALMSITNISFNSEQTDVAFATVTVIIDDTANYTINSSFECPAIINALAREIIWQTADEYYYTSEVQSASIKAYYYNTFDQEVVAEVVFSDESAVFCTAGTYTATATYIADNNYALSNETVTLVITRADSVVLGMLHQVHTYDGLQKDISAGLNHAETALSYAPQQGYTDAGIYEVTVSAAETHNYFAASLVVTLEIQKAEYTDITYEQLYDIYVPELTLADISLDADFYWVTPDMLIFAGDAQTFEAYYNGDFNNYVSYPLGIVVTIEKANPKITSLPTAAAFVADRALSVSALTGGVAGVEGIFAWTDGTEVISTVGLHSRQASFIPDDKNYYSAAFDVDVLTYFLEVNFVSFESESVVYVTYNATIAVADFPAPAAKTGYTAAWQTEDDIEDIIANATIEANYTLLNPEIGILGYSEPVIYGATVTLQAESYHELGSVTFFYQWFYNEEFAAISETNFVVINQVAESGTYKIVIAAIDGEQTKYAETSVNVIINKAQAVITAAATQEHTYDGGQKDVVAELDHSETALVYSAAGYTEANEAGYVVTLSAEETANYLAVVKEVLLVINKATVDMSAISFPDGSFVYDGEDHSLALVGALPDLVGGLSVNYLQNSLDIVGESEVIAEFVYNQNNYNQIDEMSAFLTVTPRPINVIIHDKQSVYTQAQVGLTCTVTNLVDGDELNLTLTKTGTMDAGEYAITGNIDNANYDADFTNGTYSVLRATHDMSAIGFSNKSVVYNATAQSLVISGKLPVGVTAAYANNTAKDCGSYNAIVTFGFDVDNYTAIAPMSATLTITPRPITVTFLDYASLYYDGKVKTVGGRLNGIPVAETEVLELIITYDKTVVEADYYKASAAITDENYTLTGNTQLDFIVYLSQIEHMKEQEKDVVASLSPGFLPGTEIEVTNTSQRVVIASGEYEGKESKQRFAINISGDQLSGGKIMTMRLLISQEHRYLDTLKIGKLEDDGSLSEIASVRKGDYLVFEVSDTQAEYIIIGEGKNAVPWVYGAIGGGLVLIGLSTALLAQTIKKRKILKRKVLGMK